MTRINLTSIILSNISHEKIIPVKMKNKTRISINKILWSTRSLSYYIKSIVASVGRVWLQISALFLPLYTFTKSLFIANSVVHFLLTSKTDKSRILSFVAFHYPIAIQHCFLYIPNVALMWDRLKITLFSSQTLRLTGLPQGKIINDINLNPSLTSTSFLTTKILCSWSTVKLAKPLCRVS